MTRWLILYAAAIAVGVFLQRDLQPYGEILLLLPLPVFFWLLKRGSRHCGWSLLLMWLALGALRAGQDVLAPDPFAGACGNNVQVNGVVQEEAARIFTARGEERLRMVLAAKSIDGRSAAEKLICYLPLEGEKKLRAGAEISLSGKLKRAAVYHNPGQPQSGAQLYRLTVGDWALVKSTAGSTRLEEKVFRWRQHVRNLLYDATAQPQAAILEGMLFGGSAGISPQRLEAFTSTGLVHILSVSGSHVALLLGATFWLLRFFLPAGEAAFAAALTALFYGFVCGFSAPVVRSLLMGWLALGSLYGEREGDALAALSLAAGGLLLYQPSLLYDISFQLSFSATAGLVIFSRPLRLRLQAWLPDRAAGLLAVTIGAQAGSLPFLGWYFKTVSIASLPANLLAGPLLEGVLLLGLAAAFSGGFWLAAGKTLFVLAALVLNLAVLLIETLAAMPCAVLQLPPFAPAAAALYFLLLSVPWWTTLKAAAKGRAAFVLAALLAAVLFWQPSPALEVHIIDVGQGDAVLIKTPKGGSALFDAGPGELNGDVGRRVVVPYLRHQGIIQLDYLIFSHGHDDHAGGGAAVAQEIGAKQLLLPQGETSEALLRTKRSNPGGVVFLQKDLRWQLDGVDFAVLTPGQNGASGNEGSAVIRLEYGACSFLLTGDLEGAAEAALISEARGQLKSTVLKVGHHGAQRATTAALLEAVRPAYALISVGAGNSYGHPGRETLERLRQSGAKVYRTDLDGAVVCRTDGEVLQIKGWLLR